MSVEHVSTLREFENIKRNSGNQLVVVDFHATWCGPCHAIAPFYEQLAARYARRGRFLKVDVDEAQEIAQEYGVTAMPTFQFFVNGSMKAELHGADRAGLESICERFAPSAASVSFSGSGHTIGSSAGGAPKIDWNAGSSSGATAAADAASARRDAMAKAAAARVADAQKEASANAPAPSAPAADEPSEDAAPADPAEPAPEAAAEPAEDNAQNDPRLKVDAALLRQMEEMGFPRIRAQKGLIFTGNKSLEPAMEWCFAHSDDADIDEPLALVSPDGTPKVALSEEERRKRATEALLKARARRQDMKKKEDAQREKDRIRSGKEITNARRTIEDQERKRLVELKRKEKRDAIAEKKRVKELLEADKERRRHRFNMPASKPAPAPAPVPVARGPPPQPSAGKIQLRLQDNTRLEQNFEPDQVLKDVAEFIVTSRPELAGRTLTFSQQYPRRVFNDGDLGKSLQELGLLPRGALKVSF